MNDLDNRVSKLEEAVSNLSMIGVDVSFRSTSTIIILSKINGGQVRIVEVNFETLNQLRDCVKELEIKYGTHNTIWDSPKNIFS